MDTVKIDTYPFILATAVVIITETVARRLHTNIDPLLITGVLRIIDIAAILAIFYRFYNGATVLGLSYNQILPGIKKGLIWSAGFAVISGFAGICLKIAGVDPLTLIHVNMPDNTKQLVLLYIIGCIVGPVAEEMFFRGMVYGYVRGLFGNFKQWGVLTALTVSTLLFVMVHYKNSCIPLTQLIGGVVFCISYEFEKSLLTPIIIHALGNTAIFTLSLIFFIN